MNMRISQKIVHFVLLIKCCCELNIIATNNNLDICLFCVHEFKVITVAVWGNGRVGQFQNKLIIKSLTRDIQLCIGYHISFCY